jgi:hypothetical protein
MSSVPASGSDSLLWRETKVTDTSGKEGEGGLWMGEVAIWAGGESRTGAIPSPRRASSRASSVALSSSNYGEGEEGWNGWARFGSQ